MAINDNTSYELFGYQVKDLATKIKSKAEASSLAPVATSGLYSDLTGKPTIPTVYNGTLTIQQNGTTVDTFTANSSADKTVNIETITAETVAPAEEVGAITASMIDWSTMRFPVPTNTVLQTIGNVTGNTAISISYDGFLTGKAITTSADGHAMVNLENADGGPFLGGIPYCSPNAVQVAFCIPCHAGQTFYARCVDGRLEGVKIVKAEF